MTKHDENPSETLDIRQLLYFVSAAQECNLRRAAEKLGMSQPPLSRQIQHLEEQLGLTLFVRHTRGLTVTPDGMRVLELVQSLLEKEKETRHTLRLLARSTPRQLVVGFTTAFEQGLFTKMEHLLRIDYGEGLRVVRATSLKLLRSVRKGRLALAFVALPIASQGMRLVPLPYEEKSVLAMPSHWPEAQKSSVPLHACTGRPLFWFRREANPEYFDFMRRVFVHADFQPQYREEPAEHDVLLARIAAGEGMGLFPASFAAIQRAGVSFVTIAEDNFTKTALGCVFADGSAPQLEAIVQKFSESLQKA